MLHLSGVLHHVMQSNVDELYVSGKYQLFCRWSTGRGRNRVKPQQLEVDIGFTKGFGQQYPVQDRQAEEVMHE